MNRRTAWIWISLALVCAIGAGGLTYYIIDQQAQQATAAIQAAQAATTPVPLVSVPVAARDLPRGAQIATTDLVLADFPEGLVPGSALLDQALIVDQILAQPVAQGDYFRSVELIGEQSIALSAQITPGRTVLAFPIIDLIGETGLIVAGDRVDLLLTVDLEIASTSDELRERERRTGYTVQNVLVMRIVAPPPSEEEPNPRPTAFLLEVDPLDAVVVKLVKDSGGTIDLALRSPADPEPFDVPSVTEDDLLRLLTEGELPASVGR